MRDIDCTGAAPPSVEAPAPGWEASLALRFAQEEAATRLVHRRHRGPLRIQKTLHPEGPEVCQAVIVHPPGGIAGGDLLDVTVDVGPRGRVQLITPGAAKWYRSAGPFAAQHIRLTVDDAAVLEWLPHEAILFDGAQARMQTSIALAGCAVAFAWDVVCLGRIESGERFGSGALHQRIELVRDGALVWVEQNVLQAGSRWCSSPLGLHDHPVFGTFVLAAPAIDLAWLAAARSIGSELALAHHAVTHVPGALLMRCRAAAMPHVHGWFRALWAALRPMVVARQAVTPRLWAA